MFSASAIRGGVFGRVVLSKNVSKFPALVSKAQMSDISEQTKRWDKANEIFYGPERDTVNFPHPVMPERSPKVRFGFIPETWFEFFYPKTGVTGPYVFGAGLLTYLFSKEIWVIDHAFTEVLGFTGAVYILVKKVGPMATKWVDAEFDKQNYEHFVKPLEDAEKDLNGLVSEAELQIWRTEGQKYLFEAKHENVDLQLEAEYRRRLNSVYEAAKKRLLEAEYRRRLNSVYEAAKKRLDYQLDLQNTKRSFEQRHMVNWIVDSVRKSITAQQEKESIKSCLQTLKNLSQKQAAAV